MFKRSKRPLKVGEMIDHYRKNNNLTMQELGEKVGKTQSNISKWISGDSTPQMKDMDLLCEIFNIDIDTLMYGFRDAQNSDEPVIYELPEKIETLEEALLLLDNMPSNKFKKHAQKKYLSKNDNDGVIKYANKLLTMLHLIEG